MTKSSDYVLLQSKKWRAITYDWDVLSDYGNIPRMYCLTDFQAAWILSNTQYMRWATRWDNCPCTPSELDAMAAELEYNLMSCCGFSPYELDYLYQQQSSEQLNYLQSLWDAGGNPSDVNPNTPDDYYSGDGSVNRLNALCTACKIYIYSYASQWNNQASTVLGIALITAIAQFIKFVGGSIAGILLSGLSLITNDALDAMQDTDALDLVVCCMNDALTGTTITQDNFETCLDGCAFDVGSNEEIVREIIASDLYQFQNWLSFINQVGNSYTYALAGIEDCPCGIPPECVDIAPDFAVTQPGRGVFYSNTWHYQDYVDGGQNYRGVDIKFTPTAGSYAGRQYLHVEWSYTKGSSNSGSAIAWLITYDGTPILSVDFDSVANGTYENCFDIGDSNPDKEFRITVRSSRGGYSGNVAIHDIDLCIDAGCT